ncbi:DNA-protecting protein DprA [Brevibacterium sp. 5221]|uniref:DNA-protecting protein DprA n=1 Tax=Brevibacterium rongguiense TaxID=2695267 RepID=A0A6N9H800_9MICO|nr:DNA-processing protein DprA [Brevibacterium rongguiense]MYM20093.1 DNA-protecting protein DprA [Brevibacterium rongguiense]
MSTAVPVEETTEAVADLLRIAEPGDRLLGAAVAQLGAAEARDRIVAPRSDDVEAVLHAAGIHGLEASGAAAALAVERWRTRRAELDAARDLRIMARLGARLLVPGDADWPRGLDDLGLDAPLGLWARGPGSLARLCSGSVALVGSRAADDYGIHLAKSLAFDAVGAGRTVLSGGAYGIDAAAHTAALVGAHGASHGGTDGGVGAGGAGTVAFMAGGVDRFYPRGNDALLSRIAEDWIVVSEAPPGGTAMRHRFLLRNRIIAACAAATVVVQAGWRSGAINTANRAAELLRPVGAVPGPVTSTSSAGCHRLIREGAAVLITGYADLAELVDDIDPTAGRANEDAQAPLRATDDLSTEELRVYSALPTRRGAEISALAVRAGLDPRTAMATVAGLELAGLARRGDHGWTKARP